jgi:DNA-binding MarR family transcriptional regulator
MSKHSDRARRESAIQLASEARLACERLYGLLKTFEHLIGLESGRATSGYNHAQPMAEHRVRAILKARRTRSRFFEADLFAEPAWDILLELCAAQLGQHRMSVSSLCVAAAVPATTALRWINTLEAKGLLRRQPDSTDARRTFVHLTPTAFNAMELLFRVTPALEPLL